MLLLYLLVVGSIVGAITASKPGVRMVAYITIGVLGALIGAFLTFGDTPFLLRYPLLNPATASVIVSILLVTVVRALERRVRRTKS